MKTQFFNSNQLLIKSSLAYLSLPLLLFGVFWLQWYVAIIFVGSFLGGLYFFLNQLETTPIKTDFFKNTPKKLLLIIFVVSLGWLLLSGVGGFGLQQSDYSKHNPIFHDLITMNWPVVYDTSNIEGLPEKSILSYYIAYYLPASVVGKAFGWTIANYAMFLWTLIGTFLAIAWFYTIVGSKHPSLALVFVFLGGLDFLGSYILNGHVSIDIDLEWWTCLFQFSGMNTLIVWVPQHAMAGWILTGIVWSLKDEKSFIEQSSLFVVIGLFWSPFVTIGICLLMLPSITKNLKSAFAPINFLGGLFPFIVLTSYFSANTHEIPHGFFLKGDYLDGIYRYLLLLTIEIGIVAVCAYWTGLRDRITWKDLTYIMIILALIPLYRIGYFHDFAMRTSIPLLFVFWALIARALFVNPKNWYAKPILIMILAIGGATALDNMINSITNYRYQPPLEHELLPLTKSLSNRFAAQYIGNLDSIFYKYFAKHP